MSIMITGSENIAKAREIAIAQGLALEINTGMKATRSASPLAIVRDMGFKGGRKPAALKWLTDKMTAEWGYTPSASIERALSK